MPRDPFSQLLALRRRYVRDWYWMCAGVVAVGLGIAHDSGTHPFGLLAGLGVMAAGLIVGYLGYRRGKRLHQP
jgi:1,4-dihydroxy-2-naphthoate octaprenyltransferase